MPACIYFTSTTAKHIMAASESQNAFSEVAVDKQKHSPAAACGGAQSSRRSLSLSIIQRQKQHNRQRRRA